MAVPKVPVIKGDFKITLRDGGSGGAQKSYEVTCEDGTFAADGINAAQADHTVFYDRDVPYAVRATKKKTIGISFSGHLIAFTDATAAQLHDVLTRSGTWAAAVSTDPSGGSYCLSVEVTIERSDYGGTDQTMTFPAVLMESIKIDEGDPATLSFSGQHIPFSATPRTVA